MVQPWNILLAFCDDLVNEAALGVDVLGPRLAVEHGLGVGEVEHGIGTGEVEDQAPGGFTLINQGKVDLNFFGLLKILSYLCVPININHCLRSSSLVSLSPVHGKASMGKPALFCFIPGLIVSIRLIKIMTMALLTVTTILMGMKLKTY